MARPHAGRPTLLLMLLLLQLLLTLSPLPADATPSSLPPPPFFPPRSHPPLPPSPRPPVCDIAHVTIIHVGDAGGSGDGDVDGGGSNRYAMLLHLPPFDLTPVASIQIIIDGSPASPPLPPFNGGAPLLIKASGFRGGGVHWMVLRWTFTGGGGSGGTCDSGGRRVVVPWTTAAVLVRLHDACCAAHSKATDCSPPPLLPQNRCESMAAAPEGGGPLPMRRVSWATSFFHSQHRL